MKITTNLKHARDYGLVSPDAAAKTLLVNIKQQIAYMSAGVYPVDMYVSIDDKTNNSIIVMIFLKEDTKEVYQKWCNYELG